MSSSVKPIPDGYQVVTPYLIVKGAPQAIEYFSKVFGATERMRMATPNGTIGHAELTIGDSVIMLADEVPQMNILAPPSIGGTAVSLLLYVENVDEVFAAAIAAGAKELRPVSDQFYGDRMGVLEDPFGHHWSIATHKEDLTPEEMAQRAKEAFGGPAQE